MRVAIVGAGVCGLAAGRRLAALGHEVAIYEQSRAIGGRAATRRTHGCLIDHGAQYLKTPADCPDVRRLVLDELPREGLLDIGRPVWVFDGDGRITPGDPEQNAEPKWTYVDGLATLSQRLAAGLEVRCAAHVTSLTRAPAGYRLLDNAGATLDEAERVLVTAPAPQAAELLRTSEIESRRRAAALAELARAAYRPLLSVMLGFSRPPASAIFAGGTVSEPRPYYALVNVDRRHDLSWLAVENDKGPARVSDGVLALVAQMAAPFSRAHFDEAPERLAALATARVRALLRVELGDLLWFDLAHWRYALPDATCDLHTLNRDHDGLVFSGDYVAGGRVHLALQAGLDAAALLATM
jgi:predicted NAD/FAD-dependent oxidoreductase